MTQEEKDLKEIREVINEGIRLMNRYKEVGRWDKAAEMDASISENRHLLTVIEAAYKGAVESGRKNAFDDTLQNTVSAKKDENRHLKDAIEHAEERKRLEEAQANLKKTANELRNRHGWLDD